MNRGVTAGSADGTYVVRFPFDPAANAALKAAARSPWWSQEGRAWVVEIARHDDHAAYRLVEFARRFGLPLGEGTAALAAAAERTRARVEAERAVHEEQARWNARPPRSLAEIRALVGPVCWFPAFFCGMCDSDAYGWTFPPTAYLPDGRPRFAIELRHLVDSTQSPRRLTETEYAMLETALEGERRGR